MDNPYQASIHGGAPPPSSGTVTVATVQGLAATRPWVMFCSIAGFVTTGLMAVLGLITIASAAIIGSASMPNRPGTAYTVGTGVFYFVLALIYLFPSLRLWKYGTAILHLMSRGTSTDLDNVMEKHRAFWKFVAIMMITGTVLTLLAIVAGSFAVAASAGAR